MTRPECGPPAWPDQLRGQVEENLRQLGRDRLDVVNLRLSGSGPVADSFEALADLVGAGLIGNLGLSNATADQLAEAQAVAPVVCVQNAFGLGYRSKQDALITSCAEQHIAFVPFFTIARAGREAGVIDDDHDVVVAIANARGVTPAQVRLAWTLHRGPNVLAIPGTSSPMHLVENIAAGSLALSAGEMVRLDAIHSGS